MGHIIVNLDYSYMYICNNKFLAKNDNHIIIYIIYILITYIHRYSAYAMVNTLFSNTLWAIFLCRGAAISLVLATSINPIILLVYVK